MKDAVDMLLAQEGCILKVYEDSLGIPTIGVGRNLKDKGISKDEAMALLQNDIIDAMDDVRHCFSCFDQLSRPRQLVLISMAFNLGRERLAKFVRFISSVHRGAYDEAAEDLLDSKAAQQAPVRYRQLADMMKENFSQWV